MRAQEATRDRKPSRKETQSRTEVFAWEGFSFRHPPDWAPVVLSGGRAEGYARLATSGNAACQVRWKHVKAEPNLRERLEPYFQRLEGEARREKAAFSSSVRPTETGFEYRWAGAGQGRGAIQYRQTCQRVFLVEMTAGRRDSVLADLRGVLGSFASGGEEASERWALFGLDLRLRKGLRVERRAFHAGKTLLRFRGPGAWIEAQRWGFGEQLLKRHGLSEWARAVLDMRSARIVEDDSRVELRSEPSLRSLGCWEHAIARLDPSRNQIVALRVKSRSEDWRPQWDWLA